MTIGNITILVLLLVSKESTCFMATQTPTAESTAQGIQETQLIAACGPPGGGRMEAKWRISCKPLQADMRLYD